MPQDLTIFGEGSLTFEEFAMKERLPLATIHEAVLEFLRGRNDAVLFGAHAVNVYVSEPRMTQDVDVLALRAVDFAEELRTFLAERFHIAVRTRAIKDGVGYRIYQIQQPKNRHLVDIRPVGKLPSTQRIAEILVVAPAELIAGKVLALHGRRDTPKAGTDWRDLAMLLLAFPAFKTRAGEVRDRLLASQVDDAVLAKWDEVVAQDFQPPDDDGEFE